MSKSNLLNKIPTIATNKVNPVSPEYYSNGGSISFTRAPNTEKVRGKKGFMQKVCSVRLLLLFSFIFQVLFMAAIAFTTSTIGLRQTASDLSGKISDNVVERVSAQVHNIFSLPWALSEASARGLDYDPNNFREELIKKSIFNSWRVANGQLVSVYGVLPNGDYYGIYYTELNGYDQYIRINRTESIYGYFTPILDEKTGEVNFSNPLTTTNENYDIRANEPWWAQVVEERVHLWSNVYYDPGFPGTTFYSCLYPVITDDGVLHGAFGADLSSNSLRDYLKDITISDHAEIWIIESDTGALVASSNLKERTYTDGIQNVTYAVDSNIEIIRETSKRILEQGITDTYIETYKGIYVHAVLVTDNTLQLILCVAYPKSDFLGAVTRYQVIILSISGAAFLASLAAGIYVMYLVTSPLTTLGQQMDVISDGTFESHELNKSARKSSRLYEIHSLQEDFHRMVTALRSFGKFVPVDIVRHLLRNNSEAVAAVAQKDITVMFSDIKNFTRKVEEMSPQQLSMLLSDYLNSMCAVIVENDGTVDKFIGDAVMALWNVPTPVKNHPLNACAAALDSLKCLDELNKKWIMNGLPEVQCRIGIHTGKALVGNLGSKERLAYTAVGDNVNLGSRLEALNKKYETSVYNVVKSDFLCRFLDIVIVQGRTNPTHVYELVSRIPDATPQMVQRCKEHSQAVTLFFDCQFGPAIDILHDLQNSNPLDKDVSVRLMLDRALNAHQQPALSSDWTGYLVLDEK